MQKIVSMFLIYALLISCESRKKEYYENGSIKTDYILENDQIEGVYKEYYETGGLKEVHSYVAGEKVDSSQYYYEEPKNIVNKTKYYHANDTLRIIEYFPDGSKQREGLTFINGNRIGKWFLYRPGGTLSEVLQYINLGGEEYLNQGWHFDKKEDTIVGKGNYLEFRLSKDTVNIYEPVKILVNLKEPLLSYKSDVFVGIPKGSLSDINEDFSNIKEVEWDTLPSIKKEGILDNHEKYNLYVSFGLEFNEPGTKYIRGFLSENNEIKPNEISQDSFDMKERKIYFAKKVYVKDTLLALARE